MTADRATVATTRFEKRMRLWIGDANARTGGEIPSSSVAHTWRASLAWANGRVLYTAAANGSVSIASIAPDATALADTVVEGGDMAVSSDGKTLVFISTAHYVGGEIWRSDIDGSRRALVTPGQALQPALSKDGEKVFFVSGRTGQLQSLWSVPTRGGTPVELAHRLAVRPAVSPDGTQLAFGSVDDQNRNTLVVCDIPACTNQRTTATNAFYGRWLPGGGAIGFVDAQTEQNVFVQPLNGGSPSQLTHFSEWKIEDFGWSVDARRLAILRSATTSDVVLFRGLGGT
jgi:Tol biopolymer transport system component